MRGDQARKACPELQLVQVPTAHGKADLTLYRDAGKQVMQSSFDIQSRSEKAASLKIAKRSSTFVAQPCRGAYCHCL